MYCVQENLLKMQQVRQEESRRMDEVEQFQNVQLNKQIYADHLFMIIII